MSEEEQEAKQKLREYWQGKQKESRDRQSTQKKTAIKNKRKEDYKTRKQDLTNEIPVDENDHTPDDEQRRYKSPAAKTKAVYRSRVAVTSVRT